MVWLGLIAFVSAYIVTRLGERLARRWRIVDDPQSAPERKQQSQPIPLLGGTAIILVTTFMAWLPSMVDGWADYSLPTSALIGLTFAALSILTIGILDDRFHLSPTWQLIGPVIAIVAVIASGIGIEQITNPFGGAIRLDTITWTVASVEILVWSSVFSLIWLAVTTYATKLLDGIDGLVGGIGVIGAVIVFLLTLRPEVNQPEVGTLAIIFGAACAGFLLRNWHPAKVYLGESGSLFIGFFLGLMAIISGGKLATALLILGLPILDLVSVVLYRSFVLHRSPFRSADRSHLHFRLLDQGWGVRRTVGFLYGVTAIFGLATLLVTGVVKLIVLGVLAVVTIALVVLLNRRRPPQTSS